jgi:hypothetical protein
MILNIVQLPVCLREPEFFLNCTICNELLNKLIISSVVSKVYSKFLLIQASLLLKQFKHNK